MIEKRSIDSHLNIGKLLIILCFAFLTGVFSRAVWFDEAITLQSLAATPYVNPGAGFVSVAELKPFVEGQSSLSRLISHYIETDVHPPLYFLTAYLGTLIGGTQLTTVRLVSLALTLAAVGLFASTLRRAGGQNVVAISAVFGLSFGVATSAQDARGYAMVLLLAVAAWRYLVLLPEMKSGRRRLIGEVGFGLVAAGLLYTHYFSVLLAAALMAWHLLGGLLRKERAVLVAPLVCTLAFLPWVPVLLDHLGARPDQFNGFQGIFEFLKRSSRHLGGVVLSPTNVEVPNGLAKLGHVAVLGLAVLGAAGILWSRSKGTAYSRLEHSALAVPAMALIAFAIVSIVLDKWFDTLRYYLFFAHFVAFLAANGALLIGRGFAAASGVTWSLWIPISVLLLTQFSMLNFGWETNANRGGSYFKSMATHLEGASENESLVIVDVGTGRGNVLVAAHTLPLDATAYLLPPNRGDWQAASFEIVQALEGKSQIILMFTIDRGQFGTDKTVLYTPLVRAIEAVGFKRATPHFGERESNYYVRWTQ